MRGAELRPRQALRPDRRPRGQLPWSNRFLTVAARNGAATVRERLVIRIESLQLLQMLDQGLRGWAGSIADQPIEPLFEFFEPCLAQNTGHYVSLCIEERGGGHRAAQVQPVKIVRTGAIPNGKFHIYPPKKQADLR